MSKHTQGPWQVAEEESIYGRDFVFIRADDSSAEPIVCRVGDSGDGEITTTERNANAALIAAAPDLLDQLMETRRALAWHIEQNGDVGMDLEIVRRADAAIAKATGE